MPQQIELGLDTFGDIQAGPDGQVQTHAQVIRNVIEESVLADEVGVYCIGLGEHHRPDFAISAPRCCSARLPRARSALTSPRPLPCFRQMIPFGSFSGSQPSMRYRAGAPRSSSVAALSLNRFRCSDTTYRITKLCLMTNSICFRRS